MLTTPDLLDALHAYHPAEAWAFLREVTPYTSGKADRRFDAFAVAYWATLKYVQRAFEVKASRGDFLRELKQPQKRALAMRLSNEFYFVAPRGMVQRVELPEGTGLIEVHDHPERPFCRMRVKAPWREVRGGVPWDMWCSVLRRADAADRRASVLADQLLRVRAIKETP